MYFRMRSWLWQLAFVIGFLLYLLSILFSVKVVANITEIASTLWISHQLVQFGNWLPDILLRGKNVYIARENTGFLELMTLFLLAFAAYGCCALLLSRVEKPRRSLYVWIWLGTLLAGGIYLFTPGTLSSDVFSYAMYGRILGVHFANPYFVPPSAFPHDPIYHWIYWKNTVTIYGPIWTLISAPLMLITGTGTWHMLLGFRGLAFALHLLNAAMIVGILRTMKRSPLIQLLGLLLYAWNPLMLMESSLGAHNDVMMLSFILLGVWLSAWLEQAGLLRPVSAIFPILLFTLAVLVKFSALIVLFFFLLYFCLYTLRSPDGTRKLNWSSAIGMGITLCASSLFLTLLLYGPFWLYHPVNAIIKSFESTPSAHLDSNSPLYFLASWNRSHPLPSFLQFLVARSFWNRLNSVLMLLSAFFGLFLLWRRPSVRTALVASLTALTVFLLIIPWFFCWYATWLVAVAVLCLPVSQERLSRALFALAITFSATSLGTYYSTVIGWFLLTSKPPVTDWTLPDGLFSFGVPLVVALIFFVIPPRPSLQRDK